MAASEQLNTATLSFEEKPLFVPPLEEIKNVLQEALSANFKAVEVDVVDCPDLKSERFGLKESGLAGSPLLLEIGGPPYLLPLVQRDKLYNIKEVARRCLPAGRILAIGAGAGPHVLRGTNCEGIFNISIAEDGSFSSGSYTAQVRGEQEECVLERIPDSEQRCALLLNLFLCRGERGRVLKIHCRQRSGDLNFVECLRKALEANYREQCVGMGGIFVVRQGKVQQHVMRDFSETPIHTEQQLNDWLKFYEMPAQLNALGTLITHENDLDLRLQHFHSFSASNWGGHYHHDTTPATVEYEAYLNVAERVVRVDRPANTHQVGRD